MNRAHAIGRHRRPDEMQPYSVGDLTFLVAVVLVPIFGAVVVPPWLGGWLM